MQKQTKRRVDTKTLVVRIVALLCAVLIAASVLFGVFFM